MSTAPATEYPAMDTAGAVRNVTIGVDLAQRKDWTAIAVVERVESFTGRTIEANPWRTETRELESHHHVIHMERTRHVGYPEIVAQVASLLDEPALREARLVIDATGVGNAVLDLFKDEYRRGRLGRSHPYGVTITSGTEVNGLHVPKRELVANLVALSQTGRLRFADGLALADAMRHELAHFQAKTSERTGHTRFEARRESDHDDLVISVALATFWEHRRVTPRGLRADGSYVDRDYLRDV